jgi:hypothetical protein
MKRSITVLSLFLVLGLVFAYGEIRQAFPEKSPGQFDPDAYVLAMQEKYDWLLTESVPLSRQALISIHVTEEEILEIENYKCEMCDQRAPAQQRVRIGIVKPVDMSFNAGLIRPTGDGGFVWTATVESGTATALRVHITGMDLPDCAELYIYNANGEAFGPYTGRGYNNDGEFWSHTVTGPLAFVQLRQFGPGNPNLVNFKIAGVGHLGEKFRLPFKQHTETVEGLTRLMELCDDNEECVEDASCYSGGAIDDAKYAVAHMEWVSGAWLYYCSGGLVADTDPGTQIPYFLTANHCISKSRAASGLQCYWQYWTSSCGAACYDPVGVVPRTIGATILSTDKTSDYTLMQLNEDPPAGSVFMGWTNVPVAFSDGTQLFRISYPQGSPQAYSQHVVDVSAGVCRSWPRGEWIYSRDVIGATEGGSSGSPVYNMSGQIVGQLSGACGTNVNEVCDNVNNATVDGAFAAYYDAVKQWLDTGAASAAQ